MEIEEKGVERYNKDKIIGNRDRSFVKWIRDKGLYIINRNTPGNWEGEYMYIGARSSSVILGVQKSSEL